jgi:hypothetical protein
MCLRVEPPFARQEFPSDLWPTKRKGKPPLRELALSSDIQKIRIGIQITTT